MPCCWGDQRKTSPLKGTTYRVYLNRNTLAIVLDRNLTSLSINSYADLAHVLVVLLVVCCIDQNLIKDLVQTRYKGNVAKLHALVCRVVYPHLVCCLLYRSDICVWALHDVLQMRQLCAVSLLLCRPGPQYEPFGTCCLRRQPFCPWLMVALHRHRPFRSSRLRY